MSDYEEKRALLAESLKLLTGHAPFLEFMEAIRTLKEKAIEDACRLDVVENSAKLASVIGEVRSYLDLEALVSEFERKPLD